MSPQTVSLKSLGIDPYGKIFEIKGTYYHRDVLSRLHRSLTSQEYGLHEVPVTIVPEPDNPFSENGEALSVRWRDEVIGYIASQEAPAYGQLRRIAASGLDAEVEATISVNQRWNSRLDDYEQRFSGQVRLPNPDLMMPLNDLPEGRVSLLPLGSAIQVTKENQFYEHLLDYVPASGDGVLFATLHIAEVGVKTKREGVIVELDGSQIGELSKVSSEKFIPAIRHLNEQGIECAVFARIKGSSVAAEVTIFAAKGHELTEQHLNPTEFDLFPKLVPYETDPTRYPAPSRFQADKRFETPKQKRVSPYVKHTHLDAATITGQSIPWETILVPDGTPRANLWQRGFTRAVISKANGNIKAPRIDYATVGQCKKLVQLHNQDPKEIDERGPLLMALWWILVAFLAIISLIAVISGAVLMPVIFAAPVIHHYWTRRKLKPPFAKQS